MKRRPASRHQELGLTRARPMARGSKTSDGSSMNETFPDRSPDETTLLRTENAPSRTSYLRGVIGKLDLTLDPMIPAGSIVQIDTRKREISPKKDWPHEFQRPIYFLRTQHEYVCGWCELDDSRWLTLIPIRYRLPPAGD